MTLIEDLRQGIDSILSIRDEIGAVKKPVYLVTRTWSGSEPGDGTSSDLVEQILPSPNIKELFDDIRVREGGSIQQGDLRITGISRQSYTRSDIDGTGATSKIEKFIKVGEVLYTVIHVEEKHFTMSAIVRRVSK